VGFWMWWGGGGVFEQVLEGVDIYLSQISFWVVVKDSVAVILSVHSFIYPTSPFTHPHFPFSSE
jgi:hypothetical protein